MEARQATAAVAWRARFDERHGRHGAVTGVCPAIDASLVAVLGPSVATFQLGESGTGEHLLAAARRAGAEEAYVVALQRFVAEEQEHARLLGLVLDALGVPRRTSHWSDRLFVLVRRLHSLRTEVLVLLVAEVIALSYYSALRDGVGDPALAAVFGRIHDDEVVHVAFHCETLPPHLARFPGPVRRVVRLVWSLLVTGASVAVAVDHGRLLRRVGVRRRTFVRRVGQDRRALTAALF